MPSHSRRSSTIQVGRTLASVALRASMSCILVFMGVGVSVADEVAPSAKEIRPLLVGAAVPDVPVQTIDGESVQLPEALGGKPTVLIFFRGGW